MVVTRRPSSSDIFVWQARTARPSTWTVHAPHEPTPQPYLVPVSARSSRRYQSSGMAGSPSNVRRAPLIVSEIIARAVESGRCRLGCANTEGATARHWTEGASMRWAAEEPPAQEYRRCLEHVDHH